MDFMDYLDAMCFWRGKGLFRACVCVCISERLSLWIRRERVIRAPAAEYYTYEYV